MKHANEPKWVKSMNFFIFSCAVCQKLKMATLGSAREDDQLL